MPTQPSTQYGDYKLTVEEKAKHNKFVRRLIFASLLVLLLVGLVGHNSQEQLQDTNYGYWGRVTATVDWCEENYAISHYVAEFYNTTSNCFFVLFALAGILFHPFAEMRYLIGYMSIAVIGIGSAMFHGTLLFAAQLCDELPMFYCVLTLLFISKEHFFKKTQYPRLPLALLIFVTVFSVVYYYYPFPTLFQVGWGIFTLYVVALAIDISKTTARSERIVGNIGAYALLISAVFWIFEQAYCNSTIRLFRMHAIWHFGTAFAAYCSVTSLLFVRMKNILQAEKVHYHWYLSVFPVVRYSEPALLKK